MKNRVVPVFIVLVLALICLSLTSCTLFGGSETNADNKTNADGQTDADRQQQTAEKEKDVFTVTFDAQGGTETASLQVEDGQKATRPQDPEKTGYTFDGWAYRDEAWSFDEQTVTGNVTLTATWTPVVYHVAYTLNGGENAAENPASFTVENEAITLAAPSRTGYTFTGWTWEGQTDPQTAVTIAAGTHENKTFAAAWQANTYAVTLNADGGTVADDELTATYDAVYTLPTPERTGYDFAGWYQSDVLYQGNEIWQMTDALSLTARWTPIVYTVTYHTIEGSDGVGQNPVSFTVENDTITLNAPTKAGYDFLGWTWEGQAEPQLTAAIPAGTHENQVFTANWQAISYTITYTLNGGTNAEGNPATFTVESEAFTVAAPARTGYTFTGWTWEGQTDPQPSVTVAAGTHEDKTFVAHWQAISYTVTYTLNGGENAAENPASFTVENETITLAAPSRTGYTFTGWTWEDQTDPQTAVTIAAGTHEDKTFVAHWQAISYTVTYTLNGGTNAEGNPATFTVESEAFTVAAPARTGYTFTGWTWEGQTDPQPSVTVAAGTHEDQTFVANWQANTYTVTFDANDGNAVEPMTVTYDADFTLPAATRTGYTFAGWFEGDTWIRDGVWQTEGGMALTARWRIVTYTVGYTLNGGLNADGNPKKYTIESDTFTLQAPRRTNCVFTGWTWEGQTEPQLTVTVPAGSHGNRTFVANWDVLWKDIDDLTDVDGDFTPVLRFAVTSDIHTRFMGDGDPDGTTTDEVAASTRRTTGLFRYTYQYAAKSAYAGVDAVIVVGDYTDRGMTQQYDAFTSIVNAEIRDGTAFLVCLGNHEYWNTGESGSSATVTTKTYARFEEYFGHAPDSHVVIGGYHFIGVSPDCNGGRN